MSEEDQLETPYPWDPPEYDVIASEDDELEAGTEQTMVCSNDRTNYIREGKHGLHIDEPESMDHSFKKEVGGRDEAPNALTYLQAAALGCQVNSLEMLLRKSRIEEYHVDGHSTPYLFREDNIKRVQRLELEIELHVPEDVESRARRCLDIYEQGCLVGESIKRGIDVDVTKRLETYERDEA